MLRSITHGEAAALPALPTLPLLPELCIDAFSALPRQRVRNKAAPAEHDAGCAGMLRGSEGSLNHRHLEVGVGDLGWEKGRTSHVLPGVRCSLPAGWELGNSDPFCAFKDGAENDGESAEGFSLEVLSWSRG